MTEKVIETSTIRLTADETRCIIKAAAANGNAIQDYSACHLAALGIMEAVKVAPIDNRTSIDACWRDVATGLKDRDSSAVARALDRLREAKYPKKKSVPGYKLTKLGIEVARGVAVKLNGQFKRTSC